MSIQAILFDLDDTLMVEVESARQAFLAAAGLCEERYGIDPDRFVEVVRGSARKLWYSLPEADYARKIAISSWEALWADFSGNDPHLRQLRKVKDSYRTGTWQAALRQFRIHDPSLAEKLSDTFIRERRQRHLLFPQTTALLDRLKNDYRLALITNGVPDLQRQKITRGRLESYFQVIAVSGEVGVAKPDPYIFEYTLDKMGVAPRSCLMVGNSLERDIKGACNAGIGSVWINRNGTPNTNDIRPDYEIAGLNELMEILGAVSRD